MLIESVTISRRDFDAAIFDLDGVLTDTAGVHAAAWSRRLSRSSRRNSPNPQPLRLTLRGGSTEPASSIRV